MPLLKTSDLLMILPYLSLTITYVNGVLVVIQHKLKLILKETLYTRTRIDVSAVRVRKEIELGFGHPVFILFGNRHPSSHLKKSKNLRFQMSLDSWNLIHLYQCPPFLSFLIGMVVVS